MAILVKSSTLLIIVLTKRQRILNTPYQATKLPSYQATKLPSYQATKLLSLGVMMKRTIGVLAKEVSVGIETIRFYEQKGLISQPVKPDIGYRIYPDSVVKEIIFIKRVKALGFTLDETKKLLNIKELQCHDMETLAHDKIRVVREKIAGLVKLQRGLESVISTCGSNPDKHSCPAINSLYA
jgi:MerR family mercuric resistance operon transcriptional regulator